MYFRDYAVTTEPNIVGAQERQWLEQLEVEHDNLRTALRWLLAQDEADGALRLSGALRLFWQARGYLSEGRALLDAALALDGGETSDSRARVLSGAGWFALYQMDQLRTQECFDAALPLARLVGDTWAVGDTLRGLGHLAMDRGDIRRAECYMRESLADARAHSDALSEAMSLVEVARVVEQRSVVEAIVFKQEALARFRTLGSNTGTAMQLSELGRIALAQGDGARALALYQESLQCYEQIGWLFAIHDTLVGLACIATTWGQHTLAARLWGAAETLRHTRHLPLDPRYVEALYERTMAEAQVQHDDGNWQANVRAGRVMSLEQAVNEALQISPTPSSTLHAASRPVHTVAHRVMPALAPGGLTPRELDVLRLVAGGLTNREVAEHLIVSPSTVSVHLTAIYSKLGVTSRTAATCLALDHHLI